MNFFEIHFTLNKCRGNDVLCVLYAVAEQAESDVQRWNGARSAPSTASTQTTPERQQAQRSARTLPGVTGRLRRPPARRRASKPRPQHGRELWNVSNSSRLLQMDFVRFILKKGQKMKMLHSLWTPHCEKGLLPKLSLMLLFSSMH